jgi:hypothetical protein
VAGLGPGDGGEPFGPHEEREVEAEQQDQEHHGRDRDDPRAEVEQPERAWDPGERRELADHAADDPQRFGIRRSQTDQEAGEK